MLLPDFDYDPQTRVIFGAGSVRQLGALARECGGTRALLVTDHGLRDAGHAQRAGALLKDAGISIETFAEVHSNPTNLDIEAGMDFARSQGIDLIVGLGGGSSMDAAKGINFLLTNGGQMRDYRGTGKAKLPMLPMIAIPTTAGTGSEAQSYAVISDAETHMKMACGDKKAAARVAILDPELTVTMPRMVAAVTGVDAISHALEAHVTTRKNVISQIFSRRAWQLLHGALPGVLRHPKDLDTRGRMMLGAHFAGAAIENSMLGATHSLANPLSAHYDMIHGIAIGLMLPHVIRFNGRDPDVARQYAALATDAGLCDFDDPDASHQLAGLVESLVREAELPSSLKSAGVDRNDLPRLAGEAAQQWTAQFNPRPVNQTTLLELYECAFDPRDENS